MMTGINELKTLTNRNHANVNVNLMGRNVNQINGGIMINVNVSVKIIINIKEIIFGILLHVVAKIVNKHLASIIDNSVITCNEIIDAETKTIPTNFNKKMQSVKQKVSMFYLSFYELRLHYS